MRLPDPRPAKRSLVTHPCGPGDWRARLARAKPLARDLTIILLVKTAALAFLWWAFFSAPMTRLLSGEQSLHVQVRALLPAHSLSGWRGTR